MVKLRLTRIGAKNQPFYRIIAIDARKKRDGKFIENVGYYNPISKETNIKKDLALKWLGYGAQPSNTVKSLFIKHKIFDK